MAKLWLSPEDTISPSGPQTDVAIHTASETLYKLTGEKYPGVSTSTDAITSVPPNLRIRELPLRQKPILMVHSVEIDGELLDSAAFSLRNNAYLVQKGGTPWSLNQSSEILVTYTHGSNPPRSGKEAAIRLANELILWYAGDSRCALPERITSVARQGISYTILDPQDFIKQGRTGIYAVDSFIAAVNPDGQRKKPAVFSPHIRVERIN